MRLSHNSKQKVSNCILLSKVSYFSRRVDLLNLYSEPEVAKCMDSISSGISSWAFST